MKRIWNLLAVVLLFLCAGATLFAQDKKQDNSDHLVVVWTSDDPNVAERVALMYTHAAKKNAWFKEVTLIIWGPSAKLTAENKVVQQKIAQMKKDGIKVRACIACADSYGVTDDLRALGYEVAGMGVPLTDYLKEGYKILTF